MEKQPKVTEDADVEKSPPPMPTQPPPPPIPLPWLRQLFSISSLNYYTRSIIWVLILLCLTGAIPMAGDAEFTALRSIILFSILMIGLVILKVFFIEVYVNICWLVKRPRKR